MKQTPAITSSIAKPTIAGEHRFTLTVSGASELASHIPALEDLVASATEPNVFYEPWMLLPAIKAFGTAKDLTFVLVYRKVLSGAAPQLCGFFPFERRARFARLPARALILWQYQECYLSTPLLRHGQEMPTLRALAHWARTSSDGADVIEGLEIASDGPVFSGLIRTLCSLGLKFITEWRDRPMMLPRASSEEYLHQSISGDRRRVLRSRQRNLEKLGSISFGRPDENTLDRWLDDFFRIEASGWKGRQRVAVISHDNTREFFRTVIREAFRRGRLDACDMSVAGTTVAARCSFLAGPGAFLYKNAYDEKFARYSPGGLLEIEGIRSAHESREPHWVDSCVSASFDHYLPWLDRRGLVDLAWSTGTLRGNLVMRLAPLVRRAKAWVAQRKAPVSPKGEMGAARPEAENAANVIKMQKPSADKVKAGGGA